VQHDGKEGTVYQQSAVVSNKSHFLESIHEKFTRDSVAPIISSACAAEARAGKVSRVAGSTSPASRKERREDLVALLLLE
jgi:hypothetical protein